MGNKCNCITSQSTDEAEDALLGSEQQHQQQQQSQRHQQAGEQRHRLSLPFPRVARQAPRGPPPPYQQVWEILQNQEHANNYHVELARARKRFYGLLRVARKFTVEICLIENASWTEHDFWSNMQNAQWARFS